MHLPFAWHIQQSQEASYKLCKVKSLSTGNKGIPYIVTHDARTIRFPDPLIKPHDTVKVDLATNKIVEFAKFEVSLQ
jgi:small subunit ribosomal protein S4e